MKTLNHHHDRDYSLEAFFRKEKEISGSRSESANAEMKGDHAAEQSTDG